MSFSKKRRACCDLISSDKCQEAVFTCYQKARVTQIWCDVAPNDTHFYSFNSQTKTQLERHNLMNFATEFRVRLMKRINVFLFIHSLSEFLKLGVIGFACFLLEWFTWSCNLRGKQVQGGQVIVWEARTRSARACSLMTYSWVCVCVSPQLHRFELDTVCSLKSIQ